MHDSPERITHALYDLFVRMHQLSAQAQSASYARKMLEDDITTLGYYFGTIDPMGQLAEVSLLAECIACVRIKDSVWSTQRLLDKRIDEVMKDLKNTKQHKDAQPRDAEQLVRALRSVRMVQDLRQQQMLNVEMSLHMVLLLMRLANMFVLRDGNVTDKELEEYHQVEHAMRAAVQ